MSVEIPPLRKRTKEGKLYVRPPEVEQVVVETLVIPFEDFMKRAKLRKRNHPNYLPSEVLVHRIRATRYHTSDDQFNELYTTLYERISRSCPNPATRANGKTGEIGKLMDVREYVLDRFFTLIVKDRDKLCGRTRYV